MEIKIWNKQVGKNHPCFIIAEAGINFNGRLELAKKLIDMAADAGCDAVKFQAFTAENLYPKTAGELDWQDGQKKYSYSIYDNVKKFELPFSFIPELQEHAKKRNIIYFASICDEQSGDIVEKHGVPLFKTTSYAITNLPLIEHLAKKGKPLIMSTGGATLHEIREAYETAKKHNQQLIILHCVIKYPSPLQDVNMNVLETLQREFPDAIIGYSDHTAEVADAPVAAIVKRAKVIEKHITLDKKMQGPDHFFALDPQELKTMVKAIRDTEQKLRKGEKVAVNHVILGSSDKKINESEEYLRKFAYQTIISSVLIKAGELISVHNVKVLRPGKLAMGLEPKHFQEVTSGRYKAKEDIPEGKPITWEFLTKRS